MKTLKAVYKVYFLGLNLKEVEPGSWVAYIVNLRKEALNRFLEQQYRYSHVIVIFSDSARTKIGLSTIDVKRLRDIWGKAYEQTFTNYENHMVKGDCNICRQTRACAPLSIITLMKKTA